MSGHDITLSQWHVYMTLLTISLSIFPCRFCALYRKYDEEYKQTSKGRVRVRCSSGAGIRCNTWGKEAPHTRWSQGLCKSFPVIVYRGYWVCYVGIRHLQKYILWLWFSPSIVLCLAYCHECVLATSVNNTSLCYITYDWYAHWRLSDFCCCRMDNIPLYDTSIGVFLIPQWGVHNMWYYRL